MIATIQKTNVIIETEFSQAVGTIKTGQLLRLPEVGHCCVIKGFTCGPVTEITSQNEKEYVFATKTSEFKLTLE